RDRHGVFCAGAHSALSGATPGTRGGRAPQPGDAPTRRRGPGAGEGGADTIVGGRFDPPSIRVFPGGGTGDIPPARVIEGPKTGLNWPMALHADLEHDEIAVANSGDSSIRIFRPADAGDVAPVRGITGPDAGLHGRMP